MHRCILCLLAVVCLCLPLRVQAHELATTDTGRLVGSTPPHLFYDDEDLFISVTDTAHTLNRAPAIASIISAMGTRTLAQAISTLPGFGVMYPTMVASFEAIEVRGVRTEKSEKVLFLLNGHRLNEPHSVSSFRFLSELPLDGVACIAVIRGPGSALHGDGAFLAVINIIMRDAGPDAETTASIGEGGNDALWQDLSLRHRQGDMNLFATYTHFETGAGGAPCSLISGVIA